MYDFLHSTQASCCKQFIKLWQQEVVDYATNGQKSRALHNLRDGIRHDLDVENRVCKAMYAILAQFSNIGHYFDKLDTVCARKLAPLPPVLPHAH